MSKVIVICARRILALTVLTYFLLPLIPGVTLTGDFWSALVLILVIFACAVTDMILVSLGIWFFTIVGSGFSFDFKMETRSALAPIFLSALFLAELPAASHRVGVLTFDGMLPVAASALAMALTTLAIAWRFDLLLFDLNIVRHSRVIRR